jgi:hypothetical protein
MVTAATRRAFYGAETDDAFLILMTFTHAELAEPIRVSSDAVDTTSRGQLFVSYPFDLALPDDDEQRAPRARLVIDNVDRQIVAVLRGLTSSPVLTLEIVRAAEPDTVEAVFHDFRLRNVRYDSHIIQAELTIEDFTAEPYPAGSFSPSLFPGIF